ncbi:Phosphatidylinositol (PI) 3-kinase [Thecaphora frezii]
MDKDFYSFARLTDLNLNLTFRISSLQGKLDRISRTQLLQQPEARHWGAQKARYPDLYVECRLYSDNKPLTVPVKTAYKPFRNHHSWSEWITLPYKLCDLPLNAQLAFTVYDVAGSTSTRVIGGTTFRLFSKKGTLKKAQQRLYLWKGVEGDGSAETSTPAKVGNVQDEMGRLEKLIKKHERGDLPHIDWLDKLAYRQIERIHKLESETSENLFLYVDMPRFDLPVVFCEQEAALSSPAGDEGDAASRSYAAGPSTTAASVASASGSLGAASTAGTAGVSPNAAGASADSNGIDADLFTIFDPDVARENPVEAKHRRLVRSHRSGPLDRELKPNAAMRDELNEILSYPPTRVLTSAEMDRIWSFRFYLTRDPKGLTKFLKSVVWSDAGEAKQATEVLLPMWSEPVLDDALELLGPTFRDPRVRAYAVRQLERATDEELNLYLLQLVQAIRFEASASVASNAAAVGSDGTMTASARDRDRERRNLLASRHGNLGAIASSTASASDDNGLADFLIKRGLRNAVLGNNLYWYLVVECEDKTTGRLFKKVKARFMEQLGGIEKGAERKEVLRRQGELIATLSQRAKELRSSRDPRPKKIDKLRALIADPKNGLSRFDPPLPLPLDAEVLVSGIVPEHSTIFKSSLLPLRLSFIRATEAEIRATCGSNSNGGGGDGVDTTSNLADLGADEMRLAAASPLASPSSEYGLIFKNGDDLRQDQLVIQLFTLMDRLLRNENLDLKITPYKVLATGSVDGMVQFVESSSIAGILSEYGGSLLNYLRHHHPDEEATATYKVKPAVLDTFVRSCAGYCVVTYLLGVGDRHLDNLLLSPSGHFFHVDFGYILGRDPKPFPPPVKLCKEMIDAMGGTLSPHYARFKSLCYTAFSILRKSANLILNLIALMVDANVPDIKLEPDKAVGKVQEKFALHLSEDDAIRHFEALLNETNYFSSVLDRLHDMAQYFRQ